MRYPLVDGPGQLRLAGQRPGGRDAVHRVPAGAAGDGDAARHRRGHRRLPPNYDGNDAGAGDPAGRFPNLLVNGSEPASRSGWRRTSRRTTCARSRRRPGAWSTRRPRGHHAGALLELVKGPDFPTGALIVGTGHRGRVPHRSRLDHGCARWSTSRRTSPGRPCLVVTPSCRTRSTPTTWPRRSPSWSTGKLTGIADIRDESSRDRPAAGDRAEAGRGQPRSC
jgi:DNA gyrase subunit A